MFYFACVCIFSRKCLKGLLQSTVVLILAQRIYLYIRTTVAPVWAAIKIITFRESENIQGFVLCNFL